MMMTVVLIWAVLFTAGLYGARAIRIFGPWNWRWNESSWRARGLLSETGRGVVVRELTYGHYLRDRNWSVASGATVFLHEPAARRVVDGLRLDDAVVLAYERVTNGRCPGDDRRLSIAKNQRRRVQETLDALRRAGEVDDLEAWRIREAEAALAQEAAR